MFALVLLFGIAAPFMIRLHIAKLEEQRAYTYTPPTLCEVTGIVTLNGRPFSGVIVFANNKSKVGGASYRTNASGAYGLTVEPGQYKVTLSERYENPELELWELSEGRAISESGMVSQDELRKEQENRGKQLVPEEYLSVEESPLTFDIKADGENRFDIHLYDKGDDSSLPDK